VNNSAFAYGASADGRYVTFISSSPQLVAGDTNNFTDIFVRDTVAGTTELVSTATDGTIANGSSAGPSISADGRYVAFSSSASNLVAGDANGRQDIYLRDRTNGTTERISMATSGEPDNNSTGPSVSDDGDRVGFASTATNLVAGDTNAVSDYFVYDRSSGTTERASQAFGGAQGNGATTGGSLSGDGSTVAMTTAASNLVANDLNGATTDVVVASAERPYNTLAPAATGTAEIGQTLTATDGTWDGDPTGYAHQRP
jgi:hypothetical protein